MAEWAPIPLATQSYSGRALSSGTQRLVNLYAVPNSEGAPFPFTLLPTPGLDPIITVGNGPIRGMHPMGAKLFVVSGQELYTVERSGSSYASTLIGTINGTANVRMTDNGTHVAIATQLELYVANATIILSMSTNNMNGAAYQDGYGIFTQRGGQSFYITALDDMTTIDPLDFSTADALPDTNVGCMVDHRELWIFKQRSIEIWYNSGNASFPFTRVPGGFLERGCASGDSIAKSEHHIFWLGDDYRVYRSQGYQPEAVSTDAIEILIRDQSDQSSAVGFSYVMDGHTHYVLSFTSLTIAFDATTGKWHERQTFDENRWRGNHYVAIWGKHFCGDFESGKVHELTPDVYTEDAVAPYRWVESPVINSGPTLTEMPELFAYAETGIGLVSGTGSDPQLDLQWSDDDGRTWSTPVAADLGAQGEYGTLPTWTRLGAFRKRILRLRTRDPVNVALSGLYARLEAWR